MIRHTLPLLFTLLWFSGFVPAPLQGQQAATASAEQEATPVSSPQATPQRKAPSQGATPKWEIEFHGGATSYHTGGIGKLPPAADTYSLFGSGAQGYTSKRISSWYFGSGASLIDLSSKLDSILKKPMVTAQGPAFGLRVSRALTDWIALEFTLDRNGRLKIKDTALTKIEATSSRFLDYWDRLNVAGNDPPASDSTVTKTGAQQTFTTGNVVFSLPGRSFRPYITAGAGVLFSGDSTPSITLVGSYGGPSAAETDTVKIHFSQTGNRVFTQSIGGGFKIYIRKHWGVRFDARAYLFRNSVDTLLDASHTNTPGVAWIVNAYGDDATPAIQKIKGDGLEAYSTLSGPAISSFKTFKGSGTQVQFPVTFGLFYRF